ncbi:MAG: RES family NAD+ phosphorylase [Chitinophagaceae bacterium]|nr:RES family NAD+ phosphorylase [Chitinophagaceae bacterium]
MIVYRIAKKKKRSNDLSGTGAFNEGGRWNNVGVYALYTSENRALAALEVLVHVEESELPPNLYIMTIEINDAAPIYKVKDAELPKDWRQPESIGLKTLGDKLFKDNKYIGLKVRSAIMPNEYNYILNPLYPGYNDLVKVISVEDHNVDGRLLR